MDQDNNEAINVILMRTLMWDEEELKSESKLSNDLGADSLDLMDVTLELENKFEVDLGQDCLDGNTSIQDLQNLIKQKLNEKMESSSLSV